MSILGRIDTRKTSIPYTVPAPVGGLNGRDPLAEMDANDAYFMDNLYPEANRVVARRGSEKAILSALEGPVETLAVYSGAAGESLLAWAGTKVYDITTSTPAELSGSITEPQVQTSMFSNAADNAQWLIIVNGTDTPMGYDGSAISNLTMTGITSPNDLIDVLAYKGRLFFAADENTNTLGFYYLPSGQIQGALSYFDLGQVSRLGGMLMGMATFSDSGSGETPNDYIIFITSRGECIVYNGTNPGDSTAWSLVGRYYAAAPIGRKNNFNFNGELILLTLDGAIPFSAVRKSGDSQSQGVISAKYGAITTKLGRFLSDFNQYANVQGWQGLQYARGGWLVVNVPATASPSGEYYHYVMNASTGSWCRFTDWNGMCFAVFNDRLYFGRFDGYVMLADEGRLDDGNDININVKQAYNYFNTQNDIGNLVKHFQWAEVFISSDSVPALSAGFSVNFKEEQPDYLAGIAEPEGAEWDISDWDISDWAGSGDTRSAILTLNRGGFAGSLWLRGSLSNITFEWFATQYVFERTTGLLV